jgi:electron transfer flavoprotein alpha subunit
LRNALVLVEHNKGVLSTDAEELCRLVGQFADSITAITWGDNASRAVPSLGQLGVSQVIEVTDIGGGLVAPAIAAVLHDALIADQVDAVLGLSTYDGRDALAQLSARIDRPVIANVIGFEDPGNDGLLSLHIAFGGRTMVKSRFVGPGPGIYLVKPQAVPDQRKPPLSPNVRQAPAPQLGAIASAQVVARHRDESQSTNLANARVVVAGGRGLGSAEAYKMVQRLAELLGAAAGASRAIVDAGWVPFSRQIGQTGKTVRPEVYLAFGISGATQHLVGITAAKRILAVNTDPEAPIMQLSDLAVVGDARDVLSRLVQALDSTDRG